VSAWHDLAREYDAAERKLQLCGWCGKMGHLHPDCPKYITFLVEQQIKRERLKDQQVKDRHVGERVWTFFGYVTFGC
jgi:hypothetical protein